MINKVIEIIEEILTDKGEKLDIDICKDSQLRDLGLSSFDLATLTVKN